MKGTIREACVVALFCPSQDQYKGLLQCPKWGLLQCPMCHMPHTWRACSSILLTRDGGNGGKNTVGITVDDVLSKNLTKQCSHSNDTHTSTPAPQHAFTPVPRNLGYEDHAYVEATLRTERKFSSDRVHKSELWSPFQPHAAMRCGWCISIFAAAPLDRLSV